MSYYQKFRWFLVGVCFFGCCCFVFGGGGDKIAEDFGLKKISVEGGTFYYEPSLEEKVDVFKRVYGEYRAKAKELDSKGGLWGEKKGAVLDDILKLVGGEDDEKLKTKLKAGLDYFETSFPIPLSGRNNKFYLLLQSKTKDYLRGGGKLPNMTYDKVSDTAGYKFFFDNKSDCMSNQELLLPIASADEAEKFLNAIFSALPQYGSLGGTNFIIIHEISEVAIVERLRTKDPHKRWFTDGFANAITYDVLRRNFSQKDADDFLESYSADQYEDIKKQIDLQYWMSAQFTFMNKWPIDKEKKHIHARYCFATEEAMGIVERNGVECIKKILDAHAGVKTKYGGIYTAIKKVTGEDIRKRMLQYQEFETAEEGLELYKKRYEDAKKAKHNADEMIYSLLRELDLRGENPFDQRNMRIRCDAAFLLSMTGRKEAGLESIIDFVEWMCTNKGACPGGRRLVMIYAIRVGQYKAAIEYARETLEEDKNDPYALLIMMKIAFDEKDFEKTRELASRICESETDKDTPWYKAAKLVLDGK